MNTSIIISNLSKDDFIANKFTDEALSLIDKIKLDILNLDIDEDEDYYLNRIENWSNLPFLNRVVIILKDETSSNRLYEYLANEIKTKYQLKDSVKISLQSNLLLHKSKSFDNLVDDSLSIEELKKFKSVNNAMLPPDIRRYKEPEPKKFDDNDLHKIGINVEEEQKKGDSESPPITSINNLSASAAPNFKRPRSLTKTLYKPPLTIETNVESEASIPSPTITLDESN